MVSNGSSWCRATAVAAGRMLLQGFCTFGCIVQPCSFDAVVPVVRAVAKALTHLVLCKFCLFVIFNGYLYEEYIRNPIDVFGADVVLKVLLII